MSAAQRIVCVLLGLCAAGCFGPSKLRQKADVEVRYEGNDGMSEGDIDDALARFFQDFDKSRYKKSAVDDGAFDLERAYFEAGFPEARVDYRYEERQGKNPLAVFVIHEGPRVELGPVKIRGNAAIPSDEIEPFFEPKATGLFEQSESYYVEQRVNAAAEEAQSLYQSRGFLDAQVEVERVELDEARTEATLHVRVQEGTLYRVKDIQVTGGDPRLDKGRVDEVVREFLGLPYYERLSLEIQGGIEELYANSGFADVEVARTKRLTSSDGSVELGYTVKPGPLVIVGPIDVRGNDRTRSSFVRSRVALEPGKVYAREDERKSFGHLFRSGVFDRVSIDPQRVEAQAPATDEAAPGTDPEPQAQDVRAREQDAESPPPEEPSSQEPTAQDPKSGDPRAETASPREDERPETQEPADAPAPADAADTPPETVVRPVVVTVSEGPSIETFVEPGYGSYERFRVSLGARHKNLFGTGRILDLRGTVGGLAQTGTLSYIDPWLFESDVVANLSVFGNRREEPSFLRTETGVGTTLTRRFSRRFEGSVGYQFRFSGISDVTVFDEDAMEAVEEVNISEVVGAAAYDTRDNVFLPKEGSITKGSLEYGSRLLGSELDFVRGRWQYSEFLSLDAATVLGWSAKGGVIVPVGGTQVIPLQERFYNGGENTVRSFREQGLGPKDADGKPLGGEGYSVFSVELRRRLRGRLEGALFYDIGNVVPQYADFFDFEGYQQGIGAGLRYTFPVGPIRLDAAWNPAPDADDPDYVVHVSFGMAF